MVKKSKVSKVVAFDLDGTLIDSAPDITEALNYVLELKGLKSIEVDSVRNLIGTGARALIQDSFKKQDCEVKDLESLTSSFLFKYKDCFKNKTCLYPKTKQILKELKNNDYEIILVSNKPEYYCHELLKFFNIYGYFSKVSGGDTYDFRKPDPRHLKQTIIDAHILKYNCIFVGDSKFDFQCAENFNIPCILLTHGYSSINIRKLKAFKIIDGLDNIFDIINKYFNSIDQL